MPDSNSRQNLVSHTDLQRMLHYDPLTGTFRWRILRGAAKAGREAGFIDPSRGYRRIWLFGRSYHAHRLALFYISGEWPRDVHHINGDGADNRLINLRPGLRNQASQRKRRNPSGVKGVYWDAWRERWWAEIYIDGQRVILGTVFKTKDEAVSARLAAEARP